MATLARRPAAIKPRDRRARPRSSGDAGTRDARHAMSAATRIAC